MTKIDINTASAEELNDLYTGLLMSGNAGSGNHPGSKAWLRAMASDDALAALRLARPDVEAYRAARKAEKSATALAGKDILGL